MTTIELKSIKYLFFRSSFNEKWDSILYQSDDPDEEQPSNAFIYSVLKYAVLFFLFVAVLASVMFSNGALLLAASNLSLLLPKNQSDVSGLVCSGGAENDERAASPSDSLSCVALPRRSSREYQNITLSSLTCLNVPDSQASSLDPQHNAYKCVVHQIMWGWSLFMMICVPDLFVVWRNLRRVAVGRYKCPKDWITPGIVLLVETMYAVGISLMVFIVLPLLDNVIEVRQLEFTVNTTKRMH